MSRLMGLLTSLVGVVLALCLLAGCAGPTFTSLPLPGAGVSGPSITLSADFEDALNLSRGALIKVDGVESGRVSAVRVHDFQARVTMEVKRSARLRRGATARLRYTTPLGELFVDIDNPSRGPLLHSGTRLRPGSTSTAPTVADALSETSLLINGGGLGQLQTITSELNRALDGRAGDVRDLMARSRDTLRQLNSSTRSLDAALHALDSVSELLRRRRSTIHTALHDVAPAAASIRANLGRITALLRHLRSFAGSADEVVRAGRSDALALIDKAGPILAEMSSTRRVLPRTLRAVVALAGYLDEVIPTDYLNLGTHLDLTRLPLPGGGSVPLRGPRHGLGGGAGAAQHGAGPTGKDGLVGGLLSGLLGGGR